MKTVLLLLSFALAFNSFGQVNSSIISTIEVDELISQTSNTSDTIYIVNFWATWCAPCVEEIPEFNKIAQHYKNQPVKVVMANLDFASQRAQTVPNFLNNHEVTHPIYFVNTPRGGGWIDRVDPNWSGAIPATLIVLKKKQTFIEGSLVYPMIEKQMDLLLK